jgi:SNF2 family DNA or RNA helicase
MIRPLWKDFSYFSHQIDGIHWMLDKEINGTVVPDRNGAPHTVYGGFQCDDMGLGKTIQIASTIVNNPLQYTLLIAPLAMLDTWAQVLARAGIAVFQVEGDEWVSCGDDDIPRYFIKMRPCVYISNYEKLYSKPALFRREWNRVVLDEAHKIRNADGEVARSARKIVAGIRWVVTGTPLVNSLKDVVSLLAFIGVPHSPLWRWEVRYQMMLPDLVLHRSLDSLRSVIPGAPPVPVIKNIVLPFVSEAEEEFYSGIQGADEKLLEKYQNDALSSQEAFTLLLRLRQMSVHPQVYINAKRRESSSYNRDDWCELPTKVHAIIDIIAQDSLADDTHKYIIFCQFNDEMELLQDALQGSVGQILKYHGGLSQKERSAVLKCSKESTCSTILLLQLQAGGVGLNLQEYDRIIFMSPWWTSALMDQAIARAVRMGQSRVVHVYHLHLQYEHDKALNIDTMINAKAHEKRLMLQKLFTMCAGGDE